MNDPMIKRHSKPAIFIHWFNAILWLVLLLTGLGLVDNPELAPLGMWWPNLMNQIFGSPEFLLWLHVISGIVWALGFMIFGFLNLKENVFRYLKEIFTFSITRDLSWLYKKGLVMTLGKNATRKLNVDPQLPKQGFYNTGQKLFAIPATIGGLVLFATGMIMIASKFTYINVELVQWSILVHFITAGLVFAGLIIHVYMAAIVTEERPAFWSMFSGKVPESFVKHHNSIWYEELKADSAGR